MQFPTRESDIRTLAQNIITGMSENPDFPSPPVSSSELRNLLDAFVGASDTQVVAKAAAEQATENKQSALEELIQAMRTFLHYAVDAVQGNDAKLAAIGWGGLAPREPLRLPGQPRVLEARQQGEGWLHLVWKRPSDGGMVAFYRIERRELSDGGTWALTGTAIDTEVMLDNQERGKSWEYRVIAVNKTGEGLPGNTVSAVL